MRILFLSPRPPCPPEQRETVRPYHLIRSLALHHDVDLICFSGGGVDEWEARERLRNLCHRVQIVPIETPPQRPRSVRNLFATRPLALKRYYRRDLQKRLQAVGETRRYDLVFVYSAAMAPYLTAFPGVPRIVDLVDAGSLRWMEYAGLSGFPASAVYRAEAARLMQVELQAARLAQRTLFASEAEAQAFRGVCPGNDRIASLKTPVNPRARPKGPWAAEPTILFCGHLDHFPNADAARRLLRDIFPRVRQLCRSARLVIAGKNPPADLRRLADRPDVDLVDERRDLELRYRDAWLAVAPHRVSRGVRNEILEAMALGVPVVASAEAVDGLDFLRGRDLVVESHPARFAAEVVHLLHDPRALDELGERGRKAVHNHHSHWAASIRLEEQVSQALLDLAAADTAQR